MDQKSSNCQILLTYKGKALMMYKFNSAIDTEKHTWSFIGGEKKSKETSEDALSRMVKNEANIKINDVKQVSKNFYHARLTDENVNQIQRREGQLLDFFTPSDLQKLKLDVDTRDFTVKYSNLI